MKVGLSSMDMTTSSRATKMFRVPAVLQTFPRGTAQTAVIDIDIFANCNWVNTRWQWFVHIYTQKLNRII
jgi:hypothetical protein